MTDQEIDCWGTDEVVCPYCGHKHSDSHEFFGDTHNSADIECNECGKKFHCEAEYSVDYTSYKQEE
jgi:transcription elongation factor Elf1